MTSLRQWWRRAAAALKDRRSLLLARLRPRKAPWHHRELEAAVIHATGHEDRWMDHRSAARVFAWARASPASSLRPIAGALARRARRTRCWVVALKVLMVAHGLLILRPGRHVGRVPFQLAEFRDRSSSPAKSAAFSAFVRAYYRFLDCRSLFAAQDETDSDGSNRSEHYPMTRLDRLTRLQFLLDLLLQIRPYADGMGVPLVLEAMDCAVIEIFQVYGEICTGITRFLVSSVPGPAKPRMCKATAAAGVKVIWRAAEQSAQLSSYFELCRGLGVVNARRLSAAFDRIRHEDARNLERIIMDDAATDDESEGEGEGSGLNVEAKDDSSVLASSTTTVVITEWVAFCEEKPSGGAVSCAGQSEGHLGDRWNPFVSIPLDVRKGGNLIEL